MSKNHGQPADRCKFGRVKTGKRKGLCRRAPSSTRGRSLAGWGWGKSAKPRRWHFEYVGGGTGVVTAGSREEAIEAATRSAQNRHPKRKVYLPSVEAEGAKVVRPAQFQGATYRRRKGR